MNEENKQRIEAHKEMFEDLGLWIDAQFKKEILLLLPSAVMAYKEWYSPTIKDLILGALVIIDINEWTDSEMLAFLCNAFGAKGYHITAYPMRRLRIALQVPISSHVKLSMECIGTWTPKWVKDGKGKN